MDALKQEAMNHGNRLQIIPIQFLHNLQTELNGFTAQEQLNHFQNWIVRDLYSFAVPPAAFTVRSIILAAVPHPLYTEAEFSWQGKKYRLASPVLSDFENTRIDLNKVLQPKGFHIQAAENLPLKRLAVHSGLAVYGRNNICYIEGMGSLFSLTAFFSDLPCPDCQWTELKLADACANCKICLSTCPTGAIRPDRFLIDNERCLSYFNEQAGDFPAWLPRSAHHCLYDCLKCQENCPMNKGLIFSAEPVAFNEEETGILLSGTSFAEHTLELQKKSKKLGLYQWPEAIPRNLRLLFENYER